MTRLQSRTASCECGKTTTKESGSFVTKAKIYETRSGVAGRRKGSVFVEDSNNLRLNCKNTLNLRGKIFFKKMESSLIRNVRNNKSFNLNGNSKIKLEKTKSHKKIDRDDTARTFIDNALDDIIASKLNIDMVEKKCIRSNSTFEEFSVSKNFISKEIVTHIETKTRIIQNGDSKPVKYNENDLVKECKINKDIEVNSNIKEKIVQEEDLKHKKNTFMVTENISERSFELNEESVVNKNLRNSDSSLNLTTPKKSPKKRKTGFQVFLDSCDIKLTSNKRSRKRPKSYSPVSSRKNSAADQTPAVEKSIYTLSGRLKKKCGRPPKPKGPILHYLDVYVQNKNKPVDKEEVNEEETFVDISNTTKEKTVVSESNSCLFGTKTEDDPNISVPITENVERLGCQKDTLVNTKPKDFFIDETCLTGKKRKYRKLKEQKEEPKHLNKNKSEEFGETIRTVLGYRQQKGKRELLVLFNNGTSNWISEEDKNIEFISSLKNYFEHSEQEPSTVNRLAYELIVADKSDYTFTDTTDYSSSSDLDMDSDDNFADKILFTKAKSSYSCPVPSMEVTNSLKKSIDNNVDNNISMHNVTSTCQSVETSTENNVNETATSLHVPSTYFTEQNDFLSKTDLNDLCNYVMSSRHTKWYPFEMIQEVVSKSDDEFLHIYLKRLHKLTDNNKKISDHLNLRSCEQLINILEDSAVNNMCQVVVVSGVEDYFALNYVFEKLLKKPAAIETKNYEQDVSMLRYLIQTIRNFNKPIVAVIKKTATGLPASLLSLFDMVFDERGSKTPTTPRKTRLNQLKPSPVTADDNNSNDMYDNESCQSYLFPRLMGLTESNEARIMGEEQKPFLDVVDKLLSNNSCSNKLFSSQLRNSLRHMKNNSKIQLKNRCRSQSLSSDEGVNIYGLEDGVLSTHTNRDSEHEIKHLEREVEIEKELTQKCMEELTTYIKSLESNS